MAKPEKVFRAGAVRASVFRNTIEKNGQQIPLPKVVLEARYKDKQGNWQGTNSLSMNELPKAMVALRNAYEYLLGPKEQTQSWDSSQTGAAANPSGPSFPTERIN